jgi:hypothetical protein
MITPPFLVPLSGSSCLVLSYIHSIFHYQKVFVLHWLPLMLILHTLRQTNSPVHTKKRPVQKKLFDDQSDDEKVVFICIDSVCLVYSIVHGFHSLSVKSSLQNYTKIKHGICCCSLLIRYFCLLLPY